MSLMNLREHFGHLVLHCHKTFVDSELRTMLASLLVGMSLSYCRLTDGHLGII